MFLRFASLLFSIFALACDVVPAEDSFRSNDSCGSPDPYCVSCLAVNLGESSGSCLDNTECLEVVQCYRLASPKDCEAGVSDEALGLYHEYADTLAHCQYWNWCD